MLSNLVLQKTLRREETKHAKKKKEAVAQGTT